MSNHRSIGVLILAAGKGTRMKSDLPKVLQPILGEPLLFYPLRAVHNAGLSDVAVVIGHGGTNVESYLSVACPNVCSIWQHEQLGTGHAVQVAREWWSSFSDVLVIPGDAPLLQPDSLSLLVRTHLESSSLCTFASFHAKNPAGYGRVTRTNGAISIIEEKDATPEIRKITEVNSGIYLFNTLALASHIDSLANENAQKEYYLPDVVGLLSDQKQHVEAVCFDNEEDFQGVNSPVQLAAVTAIVRKRIVHYWMELGVKCPSPDTVFIGPRVSFKGDVWIDPFVQLYGSTEVGEGSYIGSHTILRDTKIGQFVDIIHFVSIQSSCVEDHATIGPFAFIRDNACVGEKAFVGKFVEIKKSTIGSGSKVPHLSYIGDAQIGCDTNIGAGTITCNYDGTNKNPTHIGNRCFVGSDTMLVAPVSLGDNSFTAAGSVITQDVPEGALAVARARQKNVEDWVVRRQGNRKEGGKE
ncbi:MULTISPECIES: bifunctional UDP-N-acetylglucosamine diphosphorylase/glucosamine-1-phosphate N-acetyltransferase GlmU [Aminobacterium]|uniref:bifunctional UDP-N-acetylglucosamine diphosphorylase/glucosamine-1-phosphate N-acetyltransferase GlmU n=1 Tax=Aminobacterium TaxID=81466 RepID=UPI0004676871|nr:MULTISPECIES: bifunctional UDP-N-acetylglucosamine diphosphorylase/glucosamine-1-phosphate N-acetyltransferase GlmU [Aminobacterium]